MEDQFDLKTYLVDHFDEQLINNCTEFPKLYEIFKKQGVNFDLQKLLINAVSNNKYNCIIMLTDLITKNNGKIPVDILSKYKMPEIYENISEYMIIDNEQDFIKKDYWRCAKKLIENGASAKYYDNCYFELKHADYKFLYNHGWTTTGGSHDEYDAELLDLAFKNEDMLGVYKDFFMGEIHRLGYILDDELDNKYKKFIYENCRFHESTLTDDYKFTKLACTCGVCSWFDEELFIYYKHTANLVKFANEAGLIPHIIDKLDDDHIRSVPYKEFTTILLALTKRKKIPRLLVVRHILRNIYL